MARTTATSRASGGETFVRKLFTGIGFPFQLASISPQAWRVESFASPLARTTAVRTASPGMRRGLGKVRPDRRQEFRQSFPKVPDLRIRQTFLACTQSESCGRRDLADERRLLDCRKIQTRGGLPISYPRAQAVPSEQARCSIRRTRRPVGNPPAASSGSRLNDEGTGVRVARAVRSLGDQGRVSRFDSRAGEPRIGRLAGEVCWRAYSSVG